MRAPAKQMKRFFLVVISILFLTLPKAEAQIITVGPVTGTINACEYSASASPNLQQFTVSGNNLQGDITATCSGNFDISVSPGSGYSNTLVLKATAGVVNNTVIYVRTSSTDAPGPVSNRIQLTSPNAGTQAPPVSGTVNKSTGVNPVSSVTYNNGDVTKPISFTGSANSYSWTNDTPGIGLPASGTGNIPSFTATNTGGAPVVATITVYPDPLTPGGCAAPPITFNITVNPVIAPVFTATGTLSPLSTVYGTPSTSTIFTLSAANLQSGILVTPPPGFEVSTDGINFSSTVTVGSSGALASTTVYVRLAATTHVGNNYLGPIMLSTTAAASQNNEDIPQSTVTPAPLTIIADDKSRAFGDPNPVFTLTYLGFVNGDGPAQLTTVPVVSTIATVLSPVGQYSITVTGGTSPDYNITTIDGILTVIEPPSAIVIPNTFTPNGDGVNDTWNIKYLDSYLNCFVNIFDRYGEKVFSSIGYGIPWDGTYKGSRLPVGTYYYVIDLKTGYKLLSGYIAIVR